LRAARRSPPPAPLAVPESAKTFGKPIPEDDYGMPSKYESNVRRRRTDCLQEPAELFRLEHDAAASISTASSRPTASSSSGTTTARRTSIRRSTGS
jgi:hypothetical protein